MAEEISLATCVTRDPPSLSVSDLPDLSLHPPTMTSAKKP